jgi:hypothetical protein
VERGGLLEQRKVEHVTAAKRIDIDEIRRSANLLALVPRPPEPRPTARNRWQCVCPFHEDKSPSMSVSFLDFGWVFRCFACGVAGDVVNYVMRLERLSFQEALSKLAGQQVAPAAPLWSPPPKAWAIPCDGRGCGAVLDVEADELAVVDVSHPAWIFGDRVLCPRCSLRAERAVVAAAEARRAA